MPHWCITLLYSPKNRELGQVYDQVITTINETAYDEFFTVVGFFVLVLKDT